MKTGILYGIGVGPGDPELMTLKAVRLLQQCPVVAVPRASQEGQRLALEIARAAVPQLADKQLLEVDMPMVRDRALLAKSHEQAADALCSHLQAGRDVAFLTLGDPTIYSTYIYLHKRVAARGFAAQIVPGVPSFCAVAARLGISLAEGREMLQVIPGSYPGVAEALAQPGNKVLMKTGRSLSQVKQQLKAHGLYDRAMMVHNCTLPDEQAFFSLDETGDADPYMAVIIAKPGDSE